MGFYRIGTHLRLRPSSRPALALHADACTSTVCVDLKHADGGPPRNHDDQMVFHFESIIQDTSQEATFNQCARDIVEDVLGGYNGTILAYGQSGSGKTFTMSGDAKNALHKGIISRAIQRIFADKIARPESETSIHVSYLEVYNEVIYDLLTEKKEPLRIVSMMEENGQIEMKGLQQFLCETEEEALKHFLHGERRRCIGANAFHKFSNRSHCMFTIYVERHSKGREHPEKTAAKLNLVDLAGCERFKCIDAARQSEKEVLNINKSLTFLEQTVSELRKGQEHVSFRQSRLTMLLRDALGGNSKTVLIVCALQEIEFLDETIKHTYHMFKEAQSLLHAKLEKLSKENSISKLEDNETMSMIETDDGVGELDAQGFALGVAPLNWRPEKIDSICSTSNKVTGCAMLQQKMHIHQSSCGEESKKRSLAFREFKHETSEGVQQCFVLNEKKKGLKEKRLALQNIAKNLNDCKREVHDLNAILNRQPNHVTDSEQPDEESMKTINDRPKLQEQLEQVKMQYQRYFEEIANLKEQIQLARKEIMKSQQGLLNSFFEWYKKTQ